MIFCVEEAYGMNDFIELKLAAENEAECLHSLQAEAGEVRQKVF